MTTPASHGQMNNALRQLDAVLRNQDILATAQVQLQGKINQVSATQDAARSELQDLRDRFLDYVRKDELKQNKLDAQNDLITVRQQLETDFRHYGDVRRHATGVLQALDAGIVTQGTIRQVSEELMLNTPRYWLAPALVALASWIRDDQPLAERALGEAIRRDNDKTSLFFALVLRRHGRNAATARWLRQYVVRQDPTKLPREFTIVLDAVATGALGHEAQPLIHEHVERWLAELGDDQTVVDAQVQQWRTLIGNMRGPVHPGIKLLPQVSPTWPALADVYQDATVFGNATAYFHDLMDGQLQQRPELAGRVDDILNSLVKNFDGEEMPLRRKEENLQAIIENEGDRDAAAKSTKEAAFDSTGDFLTLVTKSAFYPEQMGTSQATQRWSIAMAKPWITQAVGQLEAANRRSLPNGVELAIDGWHGRIDGQSREQGMINSLAAFVDAQTQKAIAAVRFTGGPLAAAIVAGAIAVIGLLIGFGGSIGGMVFMLLVAFGIGGWSAYQGRGLPARREELRRAGEQRRTNDIATLRGAIAEVVDWRRGWSAELGREPGLLAYLNSLGANGYHGIAPDQTGRA